LEEEEADDPHADSEDGFGSSHHRDQ